MSAETEDPPSEAKEAKLVEAVDKKARRRLEAQARPRRSLWFDLGMFGLVGWAVAVPTLLGIAVGWWLDRRFPGSVSWTLTCLFLGVALGCYQAFQWIRRGLNDRR